MSNYDIEIDLLKLKGAKVEGENVVIPINNKYGTVVDRYTGKDGRTGLPTEVFLDGVKLKLSAFELKNQLRGQTHLIKPSFNKQTYDCLTEEQLRSVPWIGTLKPWMK